MKARWLLRVVLPGCLLFLRSTSCPADGLRIVNHMLAGENFFLALRPNTNDWISLEYSDDLSRWTSLASVATTNASTLIHDPGGRSAPRRFYRLRQPGFAVGAARVEWQAAVAGRDYRFRLEHVRVHDLATLSAEVRVVGGLKIISNAEVNGSRVEEPEAEDYPSVEELFVLLERARDTGCRRVAVMYDAVAGHPVWCVIERLAGNLMGKEADTYRITDLVFEPREGFGRER